jgi:uncharacterized protein YbjT (DUF2867 family)
MSEDRKIIAVVGATGAQGGGLVRAILDDPSGGFTARAITRDPDSPKARALAERGAEVVAADIDDEASLARALDGAYGAYFVTFFWAHFSPDRELQEARIMARAARAAGLRHVIWSTLEDTRNWVPLEDPRMPTLMGSYKVPHFDSKGAANQVFLDQELPVTFLLTSFYWDNFIHFGMGPAKGPDGKLAISFPIGKARLPGIAAEDIGRCAYGIFQRPELIGKTVGIAGEHLTGQQMAEGFSRLLGQPVAFNAISPEAYRALGFPGAEDLGNMFQFKRDFEDYFCGARDLGFSRSLNPRLQTFESWLQQHAAAFTPAAAAV